MSQESTSYDQVEYPGAPFDYSHPRRLEAVATLFGMNPPPLHAARVLELGCGDGSNLIPQAEYYPQAAFLGVDLAATAIDKGRQMIDALGLTNIELRAANVLEFDDHAEPFDYIIAHGLYSWVPRPVQEKILRIISGRLAPQGVAYVSYNALPGWHLKKTVRDLMLLHTAYLDSPREKVDQARAILHWAADGARAGTPYHTWIVEESKLLGSKPDGYLFHDHLEASNQPLYFRDFIQQAEAVNLQYLGEATIPFMFTNDLPERHRADLARLPVNVAEQLLDFLRNRSFRQTLLCHAGVTLDRRPSPQIMRKFSVAMSQPAELEGLDLADPEPLQFQVGGNKLEIAEPLRQAALAELCRLYPESISTAELCRRARQRLTEAGVANTATEQDDGDSICEFAFKLGTAGIFEIYAAHPPEFVATVSDRPTAMPLARYQAQHVATLTNRLHMAVQLDRLSRRLLALLDGGHSRDEVVTQVCEEVASGKLEIDEPFDASQGTPTEQVAGLLERIARAALLVA